MENSDFKALLKNQVFQSLAVILACVILIIVGIKILVPKKTKIVEQAKTIEEKNKEKQIKELIEIYKKDEKIYKKKYRKL